MPCLCGDPECPKCFPATWSESRSLRILDDAGRLCHFCSSEVHPGEAKEAWGNRFHEWCLLRAFEESRKAGTEWARVKKEYEEWRALIAARTKRPAPVVEIEAPVTERRQAA